MVAAQARYCVNLPDATAQPIRHGFQEHIADVVPERIVDALEMVEIETKNRQTAAAPHALEHPLTHAPMLLMLFKDIARGASLTLVGPKGKSATCVAFSPDGRTLAAGFNDGFIRTWDMSTWRVSTPHMAALGGAAAIAPT